MKDLYLWTDPIAMLSMAKDIRQFLVTTYPDDAPIIEQYPLTLECTVKELQEDKTGYILIGEVVNMSADESILTDGQVDLGKLKPIMFDSAANKYRVIGDIVADAFACGKKFF